MLKLSFLAHPIVHAAKYKYAKVQRTSCSVLQMQSVIIISAGQVIDSEKYNEMIEH